MRFPLGVTVKLNKLKGKPRGVQKWMPDHTSAKGIFEVKE